MHAGTEPMHKPSWFLANITLGNVIILVTVVFGAGLAWAQVGGLSAEISTMKRDQAEWRADRDKSDEVRRTTTDATLSNLLTRTGQIDGLMYRLGRAEGGIEAVNGRLDRVVEAMQRAVEPLSEKIGQLTTRVEVLAAAIERISPGKRADVRPNDSKRAMR